MTITSTPLDQRAAGARPEPVAPVAPARGTLHPVGIGDVQIVDGFWADRQSVNGAATLPHIEHWLEKEGWLGNFDLAASGGLPDGRRGREFADSEIYKYLEALGWEIGRTDDAGLEQRFRSVVARVAAAQEPDGYLNTNFGRPGQRARWTDLEWGHELYCLGHLFQAAVARKRTRPDADDGLVEIAVRAADLVVREFGADGRNAVCGHAEIEPALVELGRAVHDDRYLEQARLFVERRGHHVLADVEFGREYFQDDVPIREAEALRGHAVRANYLSAGAVDVAVDGDDRGLLDALAAQWQRTVDRRTYVTGGQGSHYQDEAFGGDFVLPSDRAYSETCAGIGSIMFSWRLLLADGDEKYADLIERTLFNVVATSPSAEGTAFFYANTLHRREPAEPSDPDEISPRAGSALRAPWFEVSCCPPNVARTLASLASLVATVDDDGLQLHQYAQSRIRTTLPDGTAVGVDVQTDYPRTGTVRVVVAESPSRPWTLSLRVPAWADGATLSVNGSTDAGAAASVAPGTATVTREFAVGDEVVLELPMQPRIVHPDPRIDAIRGTVAVERGPEVYCLELPAERADDLALVRIADGASATDEDGTVTVNTTTAEPTADGWPYSSGDADEATSETTSERLIPYHRWGNRGPAVMRVWLPVG